MYSESFTISEFTSRLSKTTLSSFEEVLELVNDYETICEQRANEIDFLLFSDGKNNALMEYEFVKGEEYLWGLIAELLSLYVAESTIVLSQSSLKNGEIPLDADFQFLFWSAIQNWLQRMKRKTTKLSTYEEPNQSLDMSFNSLFQKSTEETSFKEAELLKTMYDAFRCGSFDDPSTDSVDDWNRVFDGYSNLWRQCSLNGASANESIRETFQRFCRTFHSDNVYECILYSIHTAESVQDLQQIEEYIEQLYEESLESYSILDKLLDIVWSCVTSLLYQLSLKSKNQTHGNIRELELYTRGKVNAFLQMSSLSCQYLGYMVNDSFEMIISQPSSTCMEHSRLHSHLLLILNRIQSLMSTTTFAMDISVINYPYPFASLKQSVNYHDSLLLFIDELKKQFAIQSICDCQYYLNEQEKSSLFMELIQFLYGTLCKSPYESILLQHITSDDQYILQKVLVLIKTINNQSEQFKKEFYYQFCSWIQQMKKSDYTEYVSSSRFLCFVMRELQDSVFYGLFLSTLLSILDDCSACSTEFVTVLNNLESEDCFKLEITGDWIEYRISNEALIHSFSLYKGLIIECKRMEVADQSNDYDYRLKEYDSIFDNIIHLLEKETESVQRFLSSILPEWVKSVESSCKDSKDSILFYQLILSKISIIVSPSHPLKTFITPPLATVLSDSMKKAMVGVLYNPC